MLTDSGAILLAVIILFAVLIFFNFFVVLKIIGAFILSCFIVPIILNVIGDI